MLLDKITKKNLIKSILIYEVVFVLILILFEPFTYQLSRNINTGALFSWALGVPAAMILIFFILKWQSK